MELSDEGISKTVKALKMMLTFIMLITITTLVIIICHLNTSASQSQNTQGST